MASWGTGPLTAILTIATLMLACGFGVGIGFLAVRQAYGPLSPWRRPGVTALVGMIVGFAGLAIVIAGWNVWPP